MTIHSIIPDPEALLGLEPEQLAGVILQYLNSTSATSSDLNRYNFALPHTVREYLTKYRDRILMALMEAWVWLEREGLLAPRPGSRGEWCFITRRGKKIQKISDLDTYRKSDILPRRLLHPIIAQKVWSTFILGEYDIAVFQAFKEVEIAVRRVGEFQQTDIGVDLMRKAFKKGGVLADASSPVAEQEALSHLFAGAIGSYKNPQSHRNITITPEEAVEMIVLASHLLRIVDSKNNV